MSRSTAISAGGDANRIRSIDLADFGRELVSYMGIAKLTDVEDPSKIDGNRCLALRSLPAPILNRRHPHLELKHALGKSPRHLLGYRHCQEQSRFRNWRHIVLLAAASEDWPRELMQRQFNWNNDFDSWAA
ncbi:hypothetical protein [Bradyrhizobium brasilense]|uniref:hypothetical protein n=1 Tax=Bradyrhizobium brasilense TaxID=1419277 RepID=UPI001E46480F|nr:hypothetical protein [Bradyrhizobium brasilense]MCC8975353.1 hypothetical protein [Bradyrhizobium brasilense]